MNRTGTTPQSARNSRTCTKNWTLPKSQESNSFQNPNVLDVNYAFIIGARYTKAHSLNYNSICHRNSSTIKELSHENNTHNSETSLNIQKVPSPPNSPINLQNNENEKISINEVDNSPKIERPNTDVTIVTLSQDRNKIRKSPSTRPFTQPKLNSPFSAHGCPVTIKPSILPIVVGHKYSTREITGDFIPNSIPKINWTRASLNLHLARQSRNLRNRRQDNLKNERNKIINETMSQPNVSSLSEQNINEINVKFKNTVRET